MEASTAGGGPAAADGGEAGQAPESGGEGQDDALQSRMDAFKEQFTQELDGRYQQAESEEEAGGVYYNDETGQFEDAEGNPIQVGGQEQGEGQGQVDPSLDPMNPDFDPAKYRESIKSELAQEMQQEVQRQIQPLAEHVQNTQLAALEDEFPELRDKDVAKEVVGEAQQLAAELEQPDAWNKPNVLRTAYLARAASQRAAGETPAGEAQDVDLEAGAGGQPGPTEDDYGDRIVNAGKHKGFWGA